MCLWGRRGWIVDRGLGDSRVVMDFGWSWLPLVKFGSRGVSFRRGLGLLGRIGRSGVMGCLGGPRVSMWLRRSEVGGIRRPDFGRGGSCFWIVLIG